MDEVLRNRETLKERTNLLFSFIVSCPKLIVENMNPSNILFNIKINVVFKLVLILVLKHEFFRANIKV